MLQGSDGATVSEGEEEGLRAEEDGTIRRRALARWGTNCTLANRVQPKSETGDWWLLPSPIEHLLSCYVYFYCSFYPKLSPFRRVDYLV